VWTERKSRNGRHGKFFRLTLSNDNLLNHYQTNFALMQHHKYSLTELDEMIPFEREIYLALLTEHVKQENERIKEQEARARASSRK
jgi:hypothetical protein